MIGACGPERALLISSSLQEYNPYAGIDDQTVQVLKFQDSAHIKLALRVNKKRIMFREWVAPCACTYPCAYSASCV